MTTVRTVRRSEETPLWVKVVLGILGLVLVSGVVWIATLIFGRVVGDEFSPQTFQRRHFSFYRLPLIGIQVTGITRTARTGAVESHLLSEKLLTARPAEEAWDFVTITRGTSTVVGDAQVLINYLDAVEPGDKCEWLQWSEEHPKAAAEFWPVVARFAEEGLYVYLPDLFQAARTTQEDQLPAFKEELIRLQAKAYQTLGERTEKLGQRKAAADFFRKASNLLPDDAELQAAARRTAAAVASAEQTPVEQPPVASGN